MWRIPWSAMAAQVPSGESKTVSAFQRFAMAQAVGFGVSDGKGLGGGSFDVDVIAGMRVTDAVGVAVGTDISVVGGGLTTGTGSV
jgi:hypothetical protein